MTQAKNPFIVTGEIPDKYFCDREKESRWIVSSLTNGNNVVLISTRRLGKTSLVEHCYHSDEIRDNYYTFYIDLLPTSSLEELTYMLGKKIYDTLLPYGKRVINRFVTALTSMRGHLGYDALSGMPTFTIAGGAIQNPILTLEEIFRYLSEADKPCIVTIDEFQQVCKYPEKNVEALLRSYIQKIRNCNFVFSGSEGHIMSKMFLDSTRPFYNSATVIDLQPIPRDIYSDFIIKQFAVHSKSISDEMARYAYDIFGGNTFCVQRLCNISFAHTVTGQECTKSIIDDSLAELLDINQAFFRERLSLVPASQKPLLYALASKGRSKGIMSAKFINSNQLTSASAVQSAVRQLIDSGLITKSEGSYFVTDPLLALWIRREIL